MRGELNSFLGMMHAQRTPGETDQGGVGVRIAVYPGSGTPEITEVSASDPGSATRKFTKIVSEKVRGTVTIEDNIGGGTVATVSAEATETVTGEGEAASVPPPQRRYPHGVPRMNISERQEKAPITVLECGEVGPSTVADRLEISVSTAYRDLSVLEEHGLVTSVE